MLFGSAICLVAVSGRLRKRRLSTEKLPIWLNIANNRGLRGKRQTSKTYARGAIMPILQRKSLQKLCQFIVLTKPPLCSWAQIEPYTDHRGRPAFVRPAVNHGTHRAETGVTAPNAAMPNQSPAPVKPKMAAKAYLKQIQACLARPLCCYLRTTRHVQL